MANPKWKEWTEPDKLILLTGWARLGLTDQQIAENMGIHVATLYKWKNEINEICDALKEGKEVADFNVENALYKAACEGNTTAMIFWLKNRNPKRWREKMEVETDNKVKVTIEGADDYAD